MSRVSLDTKNSHTFTLETQAGGNHAQSFHWEKSLYHNQYMALGSKFNFTYSSDLISHLQAAPFSLPFW